MADRKDLGNEYREHVAKYIPILREPEIGLQRAGDYLEQWLEGTLPKQPLFALNGLRAWMISCYQFRSPSLALRFSFQAWPSIILIEKRIELFYPRFRFGGTLANYSHALPGLLAPASFFVRPNKLRQY